MKKKKKSDIGWGNPDPFRSTSKFHYFGEDGRSLCGKWGRIFGSPEVEDTNDEHKDNCAACMKRIAVYRQRKTV